MKKIAIIGANEYQNRLVQRAKKNGIETHVFAWEEGAVAKETADFFYPISITNKDEILNIVKELKIDGICSIASDLAMPTVNYIAEHLNLVGNSIECTILTTNKYEMRNKLKEFNLPIPEYQLINNITEIDFNKLRYPLIVKPIDRSGSRGIYEVLNDEELKDAIRKSKEVSFTNVILVEEYIEGNEYSIEAISQNGKHNILQITKKYTSGAPNFIESAHLSPAPIDFKLKREIIMIIEKALEILKVRNGASHSEIKVTSQGEIKIIEIAARMGGDFIGSDMVLISTGVDFVDKVIDVAIGNELVINYNKVDKIALVKFIFNQEDIISFNKVKREYANFIKDYNIDNNIKDVTDSASRNGYCILEIENDIQLNKILENFGLTKSIL